MPVWPTQRWSANFTVFVAHSARCIGLRTMDAARVGPHNQVQRIIGRLTNKYAMTTPNHVTLALEWEDVDGRPLPPDAKIIDDGLDQFNQSAADFTTSLKFACLARLSAGTVVGGALARWWGQCCELQQIWVDEHHRTAGIGRRLVQMVEAEARARGCSLLYLETFTFQAPGFYLKLGYEVACEFKGFPNNVSKFVMRKSLV